jgi:MFS family permease
VRRFPLVGERWLFWLLLSLMLNQAASNLIRPMVSYRALEVGVDPANLGLLSAVFSVAPLLFALRIGRLLDRRNEIRFILGGNLVMAASGFALAGSSSAVAVFAFFGVFGLGHFVAAFATQPLLARFSNPKNFDQRFAAYSFSASVGQAFGPALGGVVAGSGSSDEITRALLVGSLIALGLVLPVALVRPPGPSRPAATPGLPADRPPEAEPSLLAILRMPDVTRAILVSATVLSAIDIVIIYLPALGEERSWTASLVGTLLALRAGSSMATRLVLGWLAAHYERRFLLITSMAVSAIALLAVPLVDSIPVMAVLMVAAGAGLGIGQPMTMAWVAALAPPQIRATLLSVRVMGNGVGEVVLPVVAGLMAAFAGAGGVLAATGALTGISIVLGFGGRRRER